VQGNVYLKHEQLQSTGSFKYRGAFTKINELNAQQKTAGVVAGSSGNHGMAVAKAAGLANTPATLFVPEHSSPLKLAKICDYGALVKKVPGDCLVAETQAQTYAQEHNITYISPYNDLSVLAGQGGIGVELASQLDTIDSVLVAVGGGGLISGIGSFLKGLNSSQSPEIVGCWPENSPVLYKCLAAGHFFNVPEQATLSDGTAGQVAEGAITFDICQKVIDKSVLVSETDIKTAIRIALEQEGVKIEGAAGVALAGLIKHKEHYAGKTAVVVLCGGNIAYDTFMEIVS